MPDPQRRPGASAQDVLAVVRVYADRVHDAVRRLGCSAEAAVEVVESSALDLVDALRTRPERVPDLAGWWFARARQLGHAAADSAAELPLGGGVLAADREQQRLAGALEALPERERVALLLRDSYALPALSVGTAVGLDPYGALELVGRARLRLLPGLGEDETPSLAGHAVDLGALARLGEGPPVAARDATTRRHAQSCQRCAAVVAAQEQAHLMLAGLTVAALREEDRDEVLRRVEAHAVASLSGSTAATELVVPEDDDEDHRRLLSPLGAVFGVLLAIVAGVVLGITLDRGHKTVPTSTGPVAIAVPSLTTPPATATPTASPTARSAAPTAATTVFTIAPTVPPSPTPPARSATPGPEPLALSLSPSSGPNNADVTVTGKGWLPDRTVSVNYLDRLGRATSAATAVADARGRFTVTLTAADPTNLPGPHTVRATNGPQTQSATYNAA